MFLNISGDYPEIDPYKHKSKLLVRTGRACPVQLRCQTSKEPFFVAPMAPGKEPLYDLLPLHVAGHEQDTWTYSFQVSRVRRADVSEQRMFIATILYFDDNDWGLILGEEHTEMRFQVPAPLRGAWDRYRKSKVPTARRFGPSMHVVKN